MQTQVKLDINDVAEACRAATKLPGAHARFLANVAGGQLKDLVVVLSKDQDDPQPADEPKSVFSAEVPGS